MSRLVDDRSTEQELPVDALAASPYLRDLPEPWLQRLAESASRQTVAAGEELALEMGPDADPCLYLLVSGEVNAYSRDESSETMEVLGQESAGSVFGSVVITGEESAPAYRAVGEVEVCLWTRLVLRRLYDELAGFRKKLETRLSLRRRQSELVALLRSTPLFDRTSRSLMRWLVLSATLDWFAAGSVIFRRGDAGNAMFLIVSGEIEIALSAHRQRVEVDASSDFRRLRPGEYFGEIALVEDTTRTASAVAATDAEVLTVSKQAFDVLCERSGSFRHAVRVTAELRRHSAVLTLRDPELIWLVNDTPHPTEQLAGLINRSLSEIVGPVPAACHVQADDDVPAALETGVREGAAYVVCFSGADVTQDAARRLAERAGSVVYVTADPAAAFPHVSASPQRVHHVVLFERGASLLAAEAVRRDAFALVVGSAELRGGDLSRMSQRAQATLRRVARAIGRRRVGVALGGGAAWGYAHVVMLRGLEQAQIPVDMLIGVSMGSVVGTFYASDGLHGLDRLVDARIEVAAAALAAIGTTTSFDLFLRRHIQETRLEELSIPLATVAVDARDGQERVFRRGSIATAVRASCSLPGVFGRPIFGGHHYIDACVRNNVPASWCVEADADFVIACDVVPGPKPSRALEARSGMRARFLELSQIDRLTDTVRSLYWLASDSGRRQASSADTVFLPYLGEFFPWDFHRASAIIERTEEQLDEWLHATQSRYRALSLVGG